MARIGDNLPSVPDGNAKPTAADLGLSRKDIHDARQVRNAEKIAPGVAYGTVNVPRLFIRGIDIRGNMRGASMTHHVRIGDRSAFETILASIPTALLDDAEAAFQAALAQVKAERAELLQEGPTDGDRDE